jgi:hypothetical protein
MKFKKLLPNYGANYDLGILIPISVIGLSVFLRNFTNAIATSLFLPLFASVANNLNGSGTEMQALGGSA